jgi:hypothetical protein
MSCRKEKENNTKPQKTPKTHMPLGRQQKPWGGEKLVNKLEGDHVMYLQGWTTKPSKANWEAKWLKVRGMKETRLRM